MMTLSDMMLGEGTLAELIETFETQALRDGRPEAFKTALDKLSGIQNLWDIVRRRNGYSAGIFESMALVNTSNRFYRYTVDPEYAAECSRIYKKIVHDARN